GERRAVGKRCRQVCAVDARHQAGELIRQSRRLSEQLLRVLWRRLALLHERALAQPVAQLLDAFLYVGAQDKRLCQLHGPNLALAADRYEWRPFKRPAHSITL